MAFRQLTIFDVLNDPRLEVQAAPPSQSMYTQFLSIKKEYPDALLLFRCGDFYEAYDTDAVDASKILGITLTHRGRFGVEK